APTLDELAVLRELDDAAVGHPAVTVGDEDVAIGCDHDVGRRIERIIIGAGDAGLAEGHQHFALWAELPDRVTLAGFAVLRRRAAVVADPDVALAVDIETVRIIEHAGAEACEQLAARVPFLDRRNLGVGAVIAAAAVEGPDRLAVAIDRNADGRTEIPAHRHF